MKKNQTRTQTQVFSPFGFPSLCMIPCGPLTDAFVSTPKAVLLTCSLPLQVQMSGYQSSLKNTTPVCSHSYFLRKAKSCCSSHVLSGWEWETIPKGWVELQPLCWCPKVDVSPTHSQVGGLISGTMVLLYLSSPKQQWFTLTRGAMPSSGVLHEIYFRPDGITKLIGL